MKLKIQSYTSFVLPHDKTDRKLSYNYYISVKTREMSVLKDYLSPPQAKLTRRTKATAKTRPVLLGSQ